MPYLFRISTLIALITLITACTLPGQPGTMPPQEAEAAVSTPPPPADPREQLGKNAPYLLCDQPAYVGCYQTTHDQCVAELSGFAADCIQNADSKFSSLDTRETMQKYSQAVGMCLALRHMNAHAEQMPMLSDCIQNLQFDSAQGQRSLQK